MNFSYFQNHTAQRATAIVSLNDLATQIRIGANGLCETIKQARAVYDPNNEAEYKAIKSKLPAFNPHRFDGTGRKLKNLSDYSGAVLLDWDGLTTREAERLRDGLSLDPYVLLAFISPSGAGVKALIRTDANDKGKAHSTFEQVCQYYEPIVETALGRKHPFDKSGKDAPRLCYLSFDPQCYFNANAETFEVRVTDTTPEPKTTKHKSYELTTQISCASHEYNDIRTFVVAFLKESNFNPEKDRHNILASLAGALNVRGVNLQVAELVYVDVLRGCGLDEQYIASKIKNPLHSIYSQYVETFGTYKELTVAKRTQIHIEKYLTERADVIKEIYGRRSKTLVIAPPGGGKSTGFLQTARGLNTSHDDHTIFVTPNRDTSINLSNNNDVDALAVGGVNWKMQLNTVERNNGRLIVCVIDLLPEVINYIRSQGGRVHTVILDELHKIESDVVYRNGAVSFASQFCHDETINIIGITATPTPFMERIFDDVIEFVPSQRQTVHARYCTAYDLDYIVQKCVLNARAGKKTCVRVFSKAQGTYITDAIKKHGRTSVFLNADTKEFEYHKEIINKARFDEDVLVSTKILEDGFSFVDKEAQIDFIFLYGNNETLSPIPARQFAARARTNKETQIDIFFNPRKGCGNKEKDHLKAQIYFATHIQKELDAFEYDSNKNSYSCRTVCNSARKKINKDKTLHLFSILDESTRKYYSARADEFERELEKFFDSTCEFNAGVDSEFSDSSIKESLKAIREQRDALTKEILNACEDEYFFTALAGGYGKEMNLKSIDEWTNKQACKNILQTLGWTQEKVSTADFKNVLKRIDLLRMKRLGHTRAVRMVKENYAPRAWHSLLVESGELERLIRKANNIESNNAVSEYDKAKELELVSIIESFAKEHKTFKLESLMQHLKDINYHFYHIPNEDDAGTMEKVAMIVHAYFVCEVVHTKAGNYWQVERRLTVDDYAERFYGEGISISDISIMLNYSPRPASPPVPVPQGNFSSNPFPSQSVPESFSFRDDLLDRYFLE